MGNPEKLATSGTHDVYKQKKHNAIYVGHHYARINTNNLNKTWYPLQTTAGKDEPNKLDIHFDH